MKINIIDVPVMYGSDREGAEYGPRKLREMGLVDLITGKGHEIISQQEIFIPIASVYDKLKSNPRIKYFTQILQVNEELASVVDKTMTPDSFTLVIGGDHSLGLGSIAGASRHSKELAVCWIDAHGDINTEMTTPSGNAHGMPLANAMGFGCKELADLYYPGRKVKPENVYIIGARDLDPGEVELVTNKNINLYEMFPIHQRGIQALITRLDQRLNHSSIDGIHLSFDIDSLDRLLVPGTGTPVSDGFSLENAKLLLEAIFATGKVKSMDLVELNPRIDVANKAAETTFNILEWVLDLLPKN